MIIINTSDIAYRYTDDVYQDGDIINGISISQRGINDIIAKVYSDNLDFDFTKGYTYMLPSIVKVNNHYTYLYKVKPIGKVLIGNDNYSLDKCNDYIKKLLKTNTISELEVIKIANEYCDKFTSDPIGPVCMISETCKVLRRYKI